MDDGDDERLATKALGERIASARAEAGMSQVQLSRLVKVSRSAVAQWESGTTEPAAENLRRVADALSCGYEWLASGTGAKVVKLFKGSVEGRKIELEDLPPAARGLATVATGGREVWELLTDKIAGAGFREGDLLIIDRSAKPRAGNFVLAMSNDTPIFRVYYPPILFSVSLQAQVDPLTVDNRTIKLIGVIAAKYGENF